MIRPLFVYYRMMIHIYNDIQYLMCAGGNMNKDTEMIKVKNLLFYLVIGFIPLVLIPIDGTLETSWTKLIFLSIISILFLYICIRRRDSVTFMEDTLENRFLAGYFILVVISIFFSMDPAISLVGSAYRYDGFIAFVLYVFSYLIARNAKNVEKVMFPLITVTSMIIAIYGILQFYNIDPIPAHLYGLKWTNKAFATMGNPNFLGSYLVLSIPIPIYLYFYKGWKSGLFAYNILFLGLLCTQTRGAWIGAFISLIAFLVIHKVSRGFERAEIKKVIIVLSSSLAVILFFAFTSNNIFMVRFLSVFYDFSKIVKREEGAAMGGSMRVYVWGKVIELIKMRPLFGFGLDTMYIAMNTYFRGEIISDFGKYVNWDKSHNEYLNIAVSSGLLSLAAYLGFVFLSVKKGFSRLKLHPAFVPLLAAIIGYMVQAFFNIQVVMVYYVFFAYLGILTSKAGIVETEETYVVKHGA